PRLNGGPRATSPEARIRIDPEDGPEHVADLLFRAQGSGSRDDAWNDVLRALRGAPDVVERRSNRGGRSRRLHASEGFHLGPPRGLVDAQRRDLLGLVGVAEAVDAHDDALAAVDLSLELVRALCDLALWIAGFDGVEHPAHVVDAADVREGVVLEL